MPENTSGADRYGGFDLRSKDHDAPIDAQGNRQPPVWGGQPWTGSGEAPRHVEDLQNDLHRLGFWLVGPTDGDFCPRTVWAVREFQIYAKMERVAKEKPAPGSMRYADMLEPVETGDARYTGPVSGVVNAATRAALGHWLENGWRCPVVVEGWNLQNGERHSLQSGNLWLHDDLKSSRVRCYVVDFSGYYTVPPENLEDGLAVLGNWVTFLQWDGPRSVPSRHTWPEGELLPEALTGKALGELTPAERSTFKVTRAVAEVECLGFFDSANAYDNAFLSVGPCHWTLGIVQGDGSVSGGELPGYLAYLQYIDPDAFQQVFEFFGASIDKSWVGSDGVANGKALFNSGQRKYVGWLTVQQEDGTFMPLPLDEAEGNYFKSWHWFYRFVMAGRTIEGYRRRMGDMVRVRLRDIFRVPWGDGVAGGATLGDVFTSEKAAGILLRWHIRFPAHVLRGGGPGQRMRSALERAQRAQSGLDWSGAPAGWTDAHEAALVQGLLDEVEATGNQNLQETISQVVGWPAWAGGNNPRGYRLEGTIGPLSEARDSFQLVTEGLPPAS
jgi:hypothetical protein